MSVNYVRYDAITGRIISHGVSVSEAHATAKFIGVDTLLFADGNGLEHYVASGSLQTKLPITATWTATTVVANGVSSIVLSPLPIPCTLYVDGIPVVVNDGSFEFSANALGDYIVRIDEVGYLAQEWMISGN